LPIGERFTRSVKGMAISARAASGYSQPIWAKVIGSTRDVVKRIEGFGTDNAKRSLSLFHILRMPDASLDKLMADIAELRAQHGFAKRQWIAAPEVVHANDFERQIVMVVELTDPLRAVASGASDEVVVKEATEGIECLQELIASRQRIAA